MTDWPQTTLREVCSVVQYGFTASASQEEIGPKFLRITDIVPERLDWAAVPNCEIEANKQAKYALQEGDIVIARTGATTGYAKWIKDPPEAVFASYLVRIRANEKADSRFLGFVAESNDYKHFIQQNIGGSAQPNANAQVLTSYPLKLPPLETQRQIAAILSAYDDLIENNARRIKVLEEMAGLIYREWFVNFRFPGHEGVRRVASELREIPEGWEAVSVSEAVALDPTVKVPKNEPKDFVPMSGLNTDSMLITDFEVRTSNSGAKFQNSDTLFARITPSCEHGKTGFVQFLSSEESVAVGSTEFIVMRSRSLNPYFVYFLARLPDLRQHAINSMSGASGRQRVQKQCFDILKFAHPTQDILTKFAEIAEPVFRSVHALNAKNQNLRRTRDLLLPKLISGELDVSQLGEAHLETAQVA